MIKKYLLQKTSIAVLTISLAFLFGYPEWMTLASYTLLPVTLYFVWIFFTETNKLKQGIALVQYYLMMVGIIGVFALAYQKYGVSDPAHHKILHDYNSAYYVSITTWTGLGFSDLVPTATIRYYIEQEALTGYIYMAILVAMLFSWLPGGIQAIKDSALSEQEPQ